MDPVIASAPQAFNFNNRDLHGVMVSFTGATRRRSVDQPNPKRDGARVEDMGRGQRRLSVRLVFTGPTCAKDYEDFKSFVSEEPRGLLVHPIAGRWNAYTEGPEEEVDFSRALEEIVVRCEWKEDQLDAIVERDAPDPATAAQTVTAEQSAYQKGVAKFMGELAKAETFVSNALAAADNAIAQIDIVTAPVDFMLGALGGASGLRSETVGKLSAIATKSQLLSEAIDTFVSSSDDLFEGAGVVAGASTSTNTALGGVVSAAEVLEALLISSAVSPAGAAESVGDVEVALASCYVLQAALEAARPPIVLYTVPELMDITTVAMRTGATATALSRQDAILSLNNIPNPQAIPKGTPLLVPSR